MKTEQHKQRREKQRVKVGDFFEIYQEEYDWWPKWVSKQSQRTIVVMIYEIEVKSFTVNNQPYQIAKAYDIETNTKYEFEMRNSSILVGKEYFIYSGETYPISGRLRKKEL